MLHFPTCIAIIKLQAHTIYGEMKYKINHPIKRVELYYKR